MRTHQINDLHLYVIWGLIIGTDTYMFVMFE